MVAIFCKKNCCCWKQTGNTTERRVLVILLSRSNRRLINYSFFSCLAGDFNTGSCVTCRGAAEWSIHNSDKEFSSHSSASVMDILYCFEAPQLSVWRITYIHMNTPQSEYIYCCFQYKAWWVKRSGSDLWSVKDTKLYFYGKRLKRKTQG